MKVLGKPKVKENGVGSIYFLKNGFFFFEGKNAQVHKSVNGQKTTKWEIQEIC